MAPEGLLRDYGRALAEVVDAVLPGWVERAVRDRVTAWRSWSDADADADGGSGAGTGNVVAEAARLAGVQAREAVSPVLRALLDADVDAQHTNPLAILRGAVRFPTAVLAAAGVPPVARDEFDVRAFPDDLYALAPANFDDIDPALHDPGLMWGAAKAHVVLRRRRAEGRR